MVRVDDMPPILGVTKQRCHQLTRRAVSAAPADGLGRRLGLTLTDHRALEAGELHIAYELYLKITDLCGWPRQSDREKGSGGECDLNHSFRMGIGERGLAVGGAVSPRAAGHP